MLSSSLDVFKWAILTLEFKFGFLFQVLSVSDILSIFKFKFNTFVSVDAFTPVSFSPLSSWDKFVVSNLYKLIIYIQCYISGIDGTIVAFASF